MPSTFFGLSVATTGLNAQRRAMDIVSYNIANANDPTYKRQRLIMSEGYVLAQSQEANPLGVTAFGSGVNAGGIERIRDPLIEKRLLVSTSEASNWAFQAAKLQQIEATIGEPGDSGLANDLNVFWNTWQKVATSPEDESIRAGLLEDANALCQRMNFQFAQIQDMITDLNLETVDKVSRVNLIAEEISRLNNEISSLDSGNVPVNDLLNRRDELVNELSSLVNIQQHGEGKESFIISLGGRVLVQGATYHTLKAEAIAGTYGNIRQVQWEDDGDPVTIYGGELRGIYDMRDDKIVSYLQQLDSLAETIVDNVNLMHAGGFDLDGNAGGDFFTPNIPAGTIGAANIALDPAIVGNPRMIACSSTMGATGNGSNADAIARLKNDPVYPPLTPTQTINDMYENFVGEIGADSAIAQRQEVAHKLSYDQFKQQQQAISGVSLDEEMANMIKFQQAYNASARMLTAMDEMLTTLITAV